VVGEARGRDGLSDARTIVVKIGTSSLVGPDGRPRRRALTKAASDVAVAVDRGRRRAVLVSSGAIAAGLEPLGLVRRPKSVPRMQAAAAVGQGALLSGYTKAFARHGIVAAQVLLTQDDFVRRRHFVNAQRTFEALLAAGAVPVVNENDSVGTEEIRFGDNDRLAALVAVMVKADLFVLLSDVGGIHTRDPRAGSSVLVPVLTDPASVAATGPASRHGSGGMASKLDAAGIAGAAGIATVVANAAAPQVIGRILAGEAIGTLVPPTGTRRGARKAWMAFAASPGGRIRVDAGAERAIRERGTSLLAAGVTGAEGAFDAGDTVEVIGPAGTAFARGVTNYSSRQLPRLAGLSTSALLQVPGGPYDREVIHRDELVLMDV
jgi:glutamate 5-kinase